MEDDCGPHSGYAMAMVERAVDGDSIRAKRCFTCGGPPTTGNGEHVFPKWLQTKFGLHDASPRPLGAHSRPGKRTKTKFGNGVKPSLQGER